MEKDQQQQPKTTAEINTLMHQKKLPFGSFLRFSTYISMFAVVLGNGSTSRMFCMPVTYMMIRSKPRPKPACFTPPNFRSCPACRS